MQIRKKYGTNVYILETKEIKEGGILGTNFLSKKMYEIQVMVPEDETPYKQNKSNYTYTQSFKKSNFNFDSKEKLENFKSSILTDQKLKENNKNYLKFNENESNKNLDQSAKKEDYKANIQIETDLSDIDNLIQSLQKLKNEKLDEINNLQTQTNTNINKGINLDFNIEEKKSQSLESSQTKKEYIATPNEILQNNELKIEHPTQEEIDALLNYNSDNIYKEQNKKLEKHYIFEEDLENIDSYLMKIRENLIKSEFSNEFTQKFFQILKKKLPGKIERNPSEFYEYIIDELKNFFIYDQEFEPKHGTKIIFFVGPNGSGKTTSLAKISAVYKIEKKQNISIISLDDYRLAATEQLKIYSNILNVPFYSPIKIDEFNEVILRDNSDFVFVDTPGFSLKDEERLLKIKKFIDSTAKEKEVHLVLSATMRYDVINKFVDFFNVLNFKKIILTGLDEVKFSGFFIELADKIKKPYSFLMNGQNVPDDILKVEVEDLIKQLI